MNRTLMEKARSMLSGTELGQELWAKAVETTCYLVNRSPSSVLEDKTPHEAWTSKKPSLSYMRVFGYDAYVYVPKEKMLRGLIPLADKSDLPSTHRVARNKHPFGILFF